MSRNVQRIVSDMRSRGMRARNGSDAMQVADPRFMREHNRSLVLNYVREHGPIARAAIARETGLSRTTVSSIMDDLLKEGFAREGEMQSATSAGGRRAILVNFNAAAGYIVGIDLGRSHLTMLLTDLAATIIARHSGPFYTERGPDVCLDSLADELMSFLAREHVTLGQVIGIGIGIPGPLDASLHKLVSPPRMPGWNGVDVVRRLRQRLGVPVHIDNDANMGALGESRYGAGRGVADLAYIKMGTGIGGALVIGGQVYRGSRGSAGEIGHVSIDENGPVCVCGNRGCLETIAGADAVVADARALRGSHRGLAEGGDGQSQAEYADISTVVGHALRGDPACRAAIDRAGQHIGVSLAGLVNLMNPSLILLDGSLTHAGDLLLEPIRRAVAARSLALASSQTQIAFGELRDTAIALGGVVTVTNAVFGPSSSVVTILADRSAQARATMPATEPANVGVGHAAADNSSSALVASTSP